jgi:carbonic anhydrase
MKPCLLALPLLACLSACRRPAPDAAPVHSGHSVVAHWGYEGEDGPEYWPRLSPAYAACGQGGEQSPVNIVRNVAGDSGAWRIDYRTTSLKIAHHEHVTNIVDNGHTIQVTVDEGSTLTTERSVYRLRQFHFHTPSEHAIDGSRFPMEVHFVHQDDQGRFAVVAALFQEGPENENLARIIRHLPKVKGGSADLADVRLDLDFHLPATNASYTYMGSLTTPPCSENVEWLVFRDPISASSQQLETFARVLGPTNRPLQPLNGRSIGLRSTVGRISR